MSTSVSELDPIESQILQWPPQRRADFAEKLFQSLIDEETASGNLSEVQFDEIVRRQQRHRNGEGSASDYLESLNRRKS